MKKIILAAAAAVALLSAGLTSAYAGPQQEKMKACNKEAREKQLKGDERKAFMKDCLSAKKEAGAAPAAEKAAPAAEKAAEKKPSQQEKMKACNKEAGDKKLKGDERKAFMKDCLKG